MVSYEKYDLRKQTVSAAILQRLYDTEDAMKQKILKLSLITALLFLVLMPCFSFAEDADADDAESAQMSDYDPQDPRLPAMDEPCGENRIPVVYLTIDPDEFDKVWQSGEHTYRAPGQIRIVVPEDYEGEYSDSLTPDTGELELEYIRGRGHSTWKGAKRPFRLKLKNKADLLGMGKNKHWVLLANAFDESLLRNRIVGYIGTEMGLDYTPKMQPVDLVVNGTYRGSYTLCEHVRIDKNRIDIDKIKPSYTSEPEITGGYLLELSPGTGDEHVEITTDHGVYIGVNTPEFAEYDEKNFSGRDAQSRYIFDYIRNLEDAIYADDFTDPSGVPYSGLMDIESAAKYWWIQEFATNGDAFVTSSTYLYKERNGKLYWGPLWDFDLALSRMETDTVFNNTQMPWLDHLRAYEPEYRKVLREEWNSLDKILKDITKKDGVLDSYAAEIRSSWKNDSVAYKRLNGSENPTYEEADEEFTEAVESLRTYIDSRRIAIENSIDSDLYKVYCKVTFRDGDEILKAAEFRIGNWLEEKDYPELPEKENSSFEGWYTDPEFTNAFDQYSALTADTDLYAKWSGTEDGPAPEPDPEPAIEPGGNEDKKSSKGDNSSAAKHNEAGRDPDTGDNSDLTAWIVMLLSSVSALTSIGYLKRKRR